MWLIESNIFLTGWTLLHSKNETHSLQCGWGWYSSKKLTLLVVNLFLKCDSFGMFAHMSIFSVFKNKASSKWKFLVEKYYFPQAYINNWPKWWHRSLGCCQVHVQHFTKRETLHIFAIKIDLSQWFLFWRCRGFLASLLINFSLWNIPF